jgi:cytochrome c-type biogenesis protein CcmE
MRRISIGKKLTLAGFLIAGVTAYMAYLGASSSWQYYMTVKECVENAKDLTGQRVRISGSIAPGSLVIARDRQEARFSLTESGSNIPVVCKGPLPDDLSPDKPMDVVVEGRLEGTCTFRGDKLITRCASKYDAKKKDAETIADRRTGESTR